MSILQLYRGPRLELRYAKRLGSPLSVVLTVDQTQVMHATPSDFAALLRWLEREAEALRAFAAEPEDTTQTDNMKGDQE
jgi:hypothetical protein